jgi:DnaJ family protein C protein 9
LNDAEARAFYDETGTIAPSENADSPSYKMWEEYFARIFPKVTEKDIVDFEKEYRFSEEEKKDVLDSYVKYNGRMEDIINTIMLSSSDDEDRFIQMIDKAIDEKIVRFSSLFKIVFDQFIHA